MNAHAVRDSNDSAAVGRQDRVSSAISLQTAAVVVVVGFTLGCWGQPETVAPPAPEVTVATPTQRNVTIVHEFVGTTQARESVEIRARVQGYLEKMSFEPSSFVRKGDLLFVIEPEPYQAQRDRADAGLKAAEAGLRRAESDLDRLEQAVRTNAVSQQEVTRARAERDQASAAMLEAKAALTNAEIQLDYTTVESPIDGLVSRNLVDLGNLVGAGESTLLTTVRRIDPLFQLMGKTIVYQGGPGSGQHTKMVNQTLIASGMIAICEGLLYAHKVGLDIPTVLKSVSSGAAGSWSLSNLAPRMINGDFDPGFFVEHFLKDMKIALDEASKRNLALPGLALGYQLYHAVAAQGHRRDGTQSLILALAKLNGFDWKNENR